MLDHAQVMQALITLQEELFADQEPHIAHARQAWQRLAEDPTCAEKLQTMSTPWLLPSWQGAIDATHQLSLCDNPYQVVAVDGSQIYPDKHQGSSCYLINIAGVHLRYKNQPYVQFKGKPYVYPGRTENELDYSAIDVVNAKRQELELKQGVAWCTELFHNAIAETFLVDGSLIFWHLASVSTAIKEHYLASYITSMHELYTKRILHGGYISMPKSKELVNLLRVVLCNFIVDGCTEHKIVDHIVDTTVAGFFLQPGQRTTVFKSNALLCALYPEHLVPHFFYLHVGSEIARIEIPAWIAQNEQYITIVATIMYDQADKGAGYPVALAEAHEQAVVKNPDREFFYHIIHKLAIEHKKQQHVSQKSSKKRIMSV